MSVNITTAFVNQFRDAIYMNAQQKGSKLRPYVRVDNYDGVYLYVETSSPTIAAVKTARHAPTPLTAQQHGKRRLSSQTWQVADLIDEDDRLRMLIDPTSTYVQNMSFALGRSMDQAIIDAFAATVTTGVDGSGTAVFDTGNEVDLTSGMTVDVIQQAGYILDSNDVDEEGRIFVWSPKAKQQLLATTKATSSDYVTVKSLVNGSINSFYGFTFVMIAGATADLGLPKTGNNRTCYFYQRDSMVLAVKREITARVDVRPDMQYDTQVYVKADFGAVRLEEAKVGRAIIDESL